MADIGINRLRQTVPGSFSAKCLEESKVPKHKYDIWSISETWTDLNDLRNLPSTGSLRHE